MFSFLQYNGHEYVENYVLQCCGEIRLIALLIVQTNLSVFL